MFQDAYRFVKTAIASLAPQPEAAHRDIYGRPVEDGDDFFHPQKFKGIPVFDTQSIMRHYAELIAKLKTHVDIGDHRKMPCGTPMFKALFIDIIERYVEYAHMVPASEDHHHCHTGGLLQHSLEASIEALRWSKDHKHDLTGVMDVDQEIKPIIDYCAWLGAFVHDAGKLMRDISVDAVEIIHPLTKRPIHIDEPIPSWHPQRESLTDWARRHNISSYSVNFLRHRTHKRHTVDSAQILSPLLRGTPAQNYILSTSLHKEMYSELVRVLSGYTQSKDILSESIRMGDTLSVQKNVGIQYDVSRGYRSISTPSRIFKAMSIAVRDWDWNRNNSKGFVIGGDIYIRWSSSIDSIINAATEHDLGIPTDKKNVLNIMDSNGFISLFDHQSPEDRIVKFTPGNFTPANIPSILSGRKPVKWIELIRLRDRGLCFPPELPTPQSIPGLFLLPKANQMVIVNKEGIAITADLDAVEDITPTEVPRQLEQHESTKASSTENGDGTPPTEPASRLSKHSHNREPANDLPEDKPHEKAGKGQGNPQQNNKTQQGGTEPQVIAPAKPNAGLTGIVFKNGPRMTDPKHQSSTVQSEVADETTTSVTEGKDKPVVNNPPAPNPHGKIRGSELLHSIIEKKLPFFPHGKKVRLPLETLTRTLGKSSKEIITELEGSQELDKNMNQPSTKTVMEKTDAGPVECVQLTIRASIQFTYTPVDTDHLSDNSSDCNAGAVAPTKQGPSVLALLLQHHVPFYVDGEQALIRIDAATRALTMSEHELLEVLGQEGALPSEQPNQQDAIIYVQDGNDEPACIKLTPQASRKFLNSSVSEQPKQQAPADELSIKDIVSKQSVIIQDGIAYLDVAHLTKKQSLSIPAIKETLVRHQASEHPVSPRVQKIKVRDSEQKVIRLSDEFAKTYLADLNNDDVTKDGVPEDWSFYLKNAAPGTLLSYLGNQRSLGILTLTDNTVLVEALQLHKIGINRRRFKMLAETHGGGLDGSSIVLPLASFLSTQFDEVNYNG